MAVAEVLRVCVAAALAAAALAKLVGGEESRAALRSWGLARAGTRRAAWVALVVAEASLAVLVAAAVTGAAEAVAATFVLFTAAHVVQLARGRAGRPCGCFGARSRFGPGALVRTAALAAAAVAIVAVGDARLSVQTRLAVGVVIALVAAAMLGVAMLALAREVGELRLSLGPQSALSLPDEGPELGDRVGAVERFERPFELGLAVFSSATCALCAALDPAVRLVESEPGVAVHVFDEVHDADVWRELRVPGSPYAVVLDEAGTVVAKATFNTLAQLEGVLAEAARQRSTAAHV
jgi:hypothetical protein